MKIYKIEYEPVISRIIYVAAESEDDALELASEIINRTDAISFDESDITGVLTHVVGAIREESEEAMENDAFQASNPEGSSPEAEGED